MGMETETFNVDFTSQKTHLFGLFCFSAFFRFAYEHLTKVAQSAGAVEYTDCFSADG